MQRSEALKTSQSKERERKEREKRERMRKGEGEKNEKIKKYRKGLWSPEEDEKLMRYMLSNGVGCWSDIARNAGLFRCGKSCRLRWINYLRPDLKRGAFSPQEEELIVHLHSLIGNRWSQIASRLPGRTDNEIKNFWNSTLKKRLKNNILSSSSPQNNNQESPNPAALDMMFGELMAMHDHDMMNMSMDSSSSSSSNSSSLPATFTAHNVFNPLMEAAASGGHFLQVPEGSFNGVGMGMGEGFCSGNFGNLEAQRSMEMERNVLNVLQSEEMNNAALMNSKSSFEFDQYLDGNDQSLNIEEMFGSMENHGNLQESLKMESEWDLESFMQDISSFPTFL